MSQAQKPVPALPQVYIDTTYSLPASGQTWSAHNSTDFKNALQSAQPGDVILLDASATYSGNFKVPVKSNPNHKWIYIESAPFAEIKPVVPPGTRVNPATDAQYMARIVTPNSSSAMYVNGGGYVRFVGVEMYTTSTIGGDQKHTPWPINPWSYNLIALQTASHITVDRCYLHGSDAQDLQEGVIAWQGSQYIAVVDSVISDIHRNGQDSQAFYAYGMRGPIKLVNDHLSAAGENVLFGGAGINLPAPYNDMVPSDVEIRNNLLDKPLSWLPYTTGATPYKWSLKNLLEVKSGQRILIESNTFQNSWASGQGGAAVLFTIRSQSAIHSKVDDITFANNQLLNVVSGFATLSGDYGCGTSYTNCSGPGETRRINITNNLITFWNPDTVGGARNVGIQFSAGCPASDPACLNKPYQYPGTTDWAVQHNTFVASNSVSKNSCFASIYFSGLVGEAWPPKESVTHNVWILDNVFCDQPYGDDGQMGLKGLDNKVDNGASGYMGDPAPLGLRFYGNVMYVPSIQKVATWPVHNYATTLPLTFDSRYELVSPYWTDTTDGKVAGVDVSKLS